MPEVCGKANDNDPVDAVVPQQLSHLGVPWSQLALVLLRRVCGVDRIGHVSLKRRVPLDIREPRLKIP